MDKRKWRSRGMTLIAALAAACTGAEQLASSQDDAGQSPADAGFDVSVASDSATPSADSGRTNTDSGANDASTYDATPALGPEIVLDPGHADAGLRSVYEPRMIAGPTTHLVVWHDEACGLSRKCAQLTAARVDTAGQVLDPSGISVAVLDREFPEPNAGFEGQTGAFGSGIFLVAWTEVRNSTPQKFRILAKRVNPSGVVLDAAPIVVADDVASNATQPAVGFDGTNFLLSWVETQLFGATGTIRARRLSPAGSAVDATPMSLSSAGTSATAPGTACTPSSCVVVWAQTEPSQGLVAAKVADGAVSSPLTLAGTTLFSADGGARLRPSIAFDGTRYLAVWNGASGVSGVYVDTNGNSIEAPFTIAASTPPGASFFEFTPRAVWDGSRYRVAWPDFPGPDGKSIFGTVFAFGDSVPSPTTLVSAKAFSAPAMACTAGACVFAYRHEPYSTPRDCLMVSTWGASPSFAMSSPTKHPNGGSLQSLFGAASTSAATLVSLMDYPPALSNDDEAITRYSGAALILEPDAGSPVRHSMPLVGVVASGGGSFLVAGNLVPPANGFGYLRVGPDGSASAVTTLSASTSPSAAVAFGGGSFLVVWRRPKSGGPGNDLVAVRVGSTGNLVDATPIEVDTTTASKQDPKVTFDGVNFLVVWSDDRKGVDADIFGARVSPGGAVLDALPISISVASNAQRVPTVASNGNGAVVMWADRRNDPNVDDIYGARISGAGAVLDPDGVAITIKPGVQTSPQVVWDLASNGYVAVWQEKQSGKPSTVVGARIALPAMLPNTFVVADEATSRGSAFVAAGGLPLVIPYLRDDRQLFAPRAAYKTLAWQ